MINLKKTFKTALEAVRYLFNFSAECYKVDNYVYNIATVYGGQLTKVGIYFSLKNKNYFLKTLDK